MHLFGILGAALGAVAGYGFHRGVGCRSGACAIWSSPYVSTLYGGVLGYLLGTGG